MRSEDLAAGRPVALQLLAANVKSATHAHRGEEFARTFLIQTEQLNDD